MAHIGYLLSKLDGKKTYITSVLVALYGVLDAFNVTNFTPEQEQAVFTLLGAAFMVAMRDAIRKAEK